MASRRLPFTRQKDVFDVRQAMLRGTDCGSSSIYNDGFCAYTNIYMFIDRPWRSFSVPLINWKCFCGSFSPSLPTIRNHTMHCRSKACVYICFEYALLKMDKPANTCNHAIKKIKNAICKGSFVFRRFLV